MVERFSMGLELLILWPKKKALKRREAQTPNKNHLGNHYIKIDGLQVIYFLFEKI